MRTQRRATRDDLRLAVECLPRRTRIAMLQGIASNEIIVGAYSTQDGVCPMLAAHRAGGRTSLIAFAKAWDRFAFRDSRSARARQATERELLVLKSYLEASLLAEDAPDADLAAARSEHLELVRRRQAEAQAKARPETAPRPGDPDRSAELLERERSGWAWTRLFRRYDEYERVLAHLESERLAGTLEDDLRDHARR
jgi:hypothetical protein